jgi:hypothetical protein
LSSGNPSVIPFAMKYSLIATVAIFSYIFLACKGSKDKPIEKPVTENHLPATEDTFQTIDLFKSPAYIQSGTILDSVSYRYPGAKATLFTRYPKLSRKEFPEVITWVKQAIAERHKLYVETQKEWKEEEPEEEVFDEFMGTKLFYRDTNLVSVVLDEWITDGMHRSVWSHRSFIYDRKKRKEIEITDYFILQSSADTVFMNHLLSKGVGRRKGEELDIRQFGDSFTGAFSFAADSSNVYFFFDRYSIYGLGDWITIVPKKYIRDHIKPGYR